MRSTVNINTGFCFGWKVSWRVMHALLIRVFFRLGGLWREGGPLSMCGGGDRHPMDEGEKNKRARLSEKRERLKDICRLYGG